MFWSDLLTYQVGALLILGVEKAETWIRKRQGWPELSKRHRFVRTMAVAVLYVVWLAYQRGGWKISPAPLLDLAKALGLMALIVGIGWAILYIPLDYGRRHDQRRYEP